MNIFLSINDLFCLIVNLLTITLILWKWKKFKYRSVKILMILYLAIVVFHNLSDFLEYFADIRVLTAYEDYVQIAEPLLWGFFVFTLLLERVNKNLIESKEIIEEKSNYTDLLLDIISHDLANYNQVINGYLTILMEEDIEDEIILGLIHKIKKSVLNSDLLFDNIRILSKLEMQKIEQKKIDIIPILKSAEEKVHLIYPSVNFKIKRNFEGKNYYVLGNEIFENVAINLLTNAIRNKKKNQDKIIVEVEIKQEDEETVISLMDHGKGILDELKLKIFDRFTDTSQKSKGRGLGLSISKRIIEGLGGKIWVENRPDSLHDYSSGSVFKIVLKSAHSN